MHRRPKEWAGTQEREEHGERGARVDDIRLGAKPSAGFSDDGQSSWSWGQELFSPGSNSVQPNARPNQQEQQNESYPQCTESVILAPPEHEMNQQPYSTLFGSVKKKNYLGDIRFGDVRVIWGLSPRSLLYHPNVFVAQNHDDRSVHTRVRSSSNVLSNDNVVLLV